MAKKNPEVPKRVLAFLKEARQQITRSKRPRVGFLAQLHGLSPNAAIAAQDIGLMNCKGRTWTWTTGRPTVAQADQVRERMNEIYR